LNYSISLADPYALNQMLLPVLDAGTVARGMRNPGK
jgi:hypothetical protein